MLKQKYLMWLGVLLVLAAAAMFVLAQDATEPSPEANKALIVEYLEAISGKEKPLSLQQQYIAESDQELMDHIAMFEAAFPLYELVAEELIAEGDKVFVRVTFRGTQAAEFAGVPAAGAEVEIPIALIYRIEDNKIAEHWMLADVMTMMQQLGAIPTSTE